MLFPIPTRMFKITKFKVVYIWVQYVICFTKHKKGTRCTFGLLILSLFVMWQITEKGFLRDIMGRPLMTLASDSNPWWSVFNEAVTRAGGKLSKPEILASTTDARFMRRLGIPTFGFSPMKNTPILLHDHNEVCLCFYLWQISNHLFLWCQSFCSPGRTSRILFIWRGLRCMNAL